MGDPFATLLSNFKGEKKELVQSSPRNASLNAILCESSSKSFESSSALDKLQVQDTSKNAKTVQYDPENAFSERNSADDSLNELFCLRDSASPLPPPEKESIAFDFDTTVRDLNPANLNEAMWGLEGPLLEGVHGMESEPINARGISTEDANSCYDQGLFYIDAQEVLQNGKKFQQRNGFTAGQRSDSDNDRVFTFRKDNEEENLISFASNLFTKGRDLVENKINKTFENIGNRRSTPFEFKLFSSENTNSRSHTNKYEPELSRDSSNSDYISKKFDGLSVDEDKGNPCLNKEENYADLLSHAFLDTGDTEAKDRIWGQSQNVHSQESLYSAEDGKLIDFDTEEAPPPASKVSSHYVPISQIEMSGYQEFNINGKQYFRNGDYHNAHQQYIKSLNTLPVGHPLRIVAYSNIITTQLKIGEHTESLKNIEKACDLLDGSSLDGIIQGTNPPKTYKEFWNKIISKKAEVLEYLEHYDEALAVYRCLISKGVFDKKIIEGKTRCQKHSKITSEPATEDSALAPVQKDKVPKSNNSSIPERRIRSQKAEELIKKRQEMKELEKQKFRLHDKVHSKIQSWIDGKETDLRHLLSRLSLVLTWTNWNHIGANDLVIPKKVKIIYMKAISKVHPDKVPSTLDLESKMLAEDIFSVLGNAWNVFKLNNDIN
ncbi:auxilin-like protein SWA2 Ecym_8181 [Eremothecium cymbalariae DBVPG|uniref:SWA2-like ubiquitin-associated domain-containing protein n=1 Tax=Eremothecium cymbalariae (strain CBS 270.75 / DBVPG 7215 / KCTC 17166 / NRRL Y-17582) TaxID=931890 RepID=G8JX93_ERECY|nr:Hypothetical protein Ecym_8181 [Eremothecium cymbalariae DBVPG\